MGWCNNGRSELSLPPPTTSPMAISGTCGTDLGLKRSIQELLLVLVYVEEAEGEGWKNRNRGVYKDAKKNNT